MKITKEVMKEIDTARDHIVSLADQQDDVYNALKAKLNVVDKDGFLFDYVYGNTDNSEILKRTE